MKKIKIVNLIFILAAVVLDVIFLAKSNVIFAYLLVVLAFANILFAQINKINKKEFSIFLIIGLILMIYSGILIHEHYLRNSLIFVIGEGFLFLSLCQAKEFRFRDLIYIGILFIICCAILTPLNYLNFTSRYYTCMTISYYGAALAISMVMGKALSNYINRKTKLNTLLVISALLLTISCVLFAVDAYSKAGGALTVLTYITLFMSQMILVYSICINNVRYKIFK